MKLFPIPLLVFLAPVLAAGGKPPPVRAERVAEILERARPVLVSMTGLPWPAGLTVERTDRAGLTAVLLEEFREEVAVLHPRRSPASREYLARVLARSFARVLRAKYGLRTKRIHVAPGALAGLPPGVDPDQVLVHLVTHEAVHALDDAAVDLGKLIRAAPDPEAHRALRMVIEGRAEYYGTRAAARLGVPETVGAVLAAGRDAGERLLRDAGRRFVAALAKRDPSLPLAALRKPPRSTSTVFHPDRYGRPAAIPDLAKPLAASGLPGPDVALSELLLRKRFREHLSKEDVARTFGGYLAGAAREERGKRRVSLVVLTGEKEAKVFLAGLRAFQGDPPAGGRPYAWTALRRGRYVVESVTPKGTDPRPPAQDTLAKVTYGGGGNL